MTSPLTPEERAEVRRQVEEMRAYASAVPYTGLLSQTIREMGEAISRLLDERDSLERRALQVANAEHEAARLRLLGESDARELLKAETSRDALEARLEQARATAGAMVHAQWCLARLNPAPGVCECGLFVLRAALEPGAGS